MIYTSYFAKYKHDNGISIALKSPNWFTGKGECSLLFPRWSFLKQYKEDRNQETYTEQYNELILSKLNPVEIYNLLDGHVLLCWEKSGEFCHRRLVAKWLQDKLNIFVPEINDNNKHS